MSIHKSFKAGKNTKFRNVRKRWERYRSLVLQNNWDKEHSNVFELPKEKIIRFKKKKVEKEETPENPILAELAKKTEKK